MKNRERGKLEVHSGGKYRATLTMYTEAQAMEVFNAEWATGKHEYLALIKDCRLGGENMFYIEDEPPLIRNHEKLLAERTHGGELKSGRLGRATYRGGLTS